MSSLFLWQEIRERLVCPTCHGPVEVTPGTLHCAACAADYTTRDGFPMMVPMDESEALAAPACDLSVMIMAYNEAENLARLFPELLPILNDLGVSFEIVVVDGRSKDDTVAVAERHGARVHVQRERGYGNGVREGMSACRGEYVLNIDADLSHDPGFVRTLWQRRAEADLLVGSRYTVGAEAEMTWFRFWLSRFMNGVFRRVLAIPVRDLSSGFRLYHASALAGLGLVGRDFEVLVEALVRIYAQGGTIRELPMYYRPRGAGASNLRVASFGVSYFLALLNLSCVRRSKTSADADRAAYHSMDPFEQARQRGRCEAVRQLLDGAESDLLDVSGSSVLLQSLPRAVAFDVRRSRLRFLRATNALLVGGNPAAMPFRTAAFETAMYAPTCARLTDPAEVLPELHRVVRPGGHLIYAEPVSSGPAWRAAAAALASGRTSWRAVVSPLTSAAGMVAEPRPGKHPPDAMAARLREYGFEPVDARVVGGTDWVVRARRSDADVPLS